MRPPQCPQDSCIQRQCEPINRVKVHHEIYYGGRCTDHGKRPPPFLADKHANPRGQKAQPRYPKEYRQQPRDDGGLQTKKSEEPRATQGSGPPAQPRRVLKRGASSSRYRDGDQTVDKKKYAYEYPHPEYPSSPCSLVRSPSRCNHDATQRGPAHRSEAYSPDCVEGEFSEVRMQHPV